MKKICSLLALVALFFAASAQNESSNDYDDGINKKWELKVDVTANMAGRGDPNEGDGLTDLDESMGADLGVGYNFTSNWYAGLSSGFWYHWGGESNNMIPVLADVVWRWNLGASEKYSLFLEGRAGYLFGLKSDRESFHQLKDYRFSDHGYVDIQPGIYFRCGRNFDIRLSLGYAYTRPIHNYEDKYFARMTDEEREQLGKDYFFAQPEHVVSLKLGFNFRGKPTTPPRILSVDDDLDLLELEVREQQREAERAEFRAEKAAQRLAKKDEQFEKQIQKTMEKESDLVLYYIIPDAYQMPDLQPDLVELAEWAKSHKNGRIILKAYITSTKSALSYASDARKRIKHVKDILVKNYGIKPSSIKSDIYVVTDKTARENDISRRVDIYQRLRE